VQLHDTPLLKVGGRFYYNVTRYTTSIFLRLKLGEALQRRHVAPDI
jgi:propionate CoA-transferase